MVGQRWSCRWLTWVIGSTMYRLWKIVRIIQIIRLMLVFFRPAWTKFSEQRPRIEMKEHVRTVLTVLRLSWVVTLVDIVLEKVIPNKQWSWSADNSTSDHSTRSIKPFWLASSDRKDHHLPKKKQISNQFPAYLRIWPFQKACHSWIDSLSLQMLIPSSVPTFFRSQRQ